VPLLILYRAGDLPDRWSVWIVAAVLLSSGYGFASLDAKTSDYFFTGFPSYWNIVALYLHAARTPDVVNAVVLLAFVVLVFVRIGYVYPSRTPVLWGVTNVLGAIWAVMMLVVVWRLPDVPQSLLIASLFFPVYYAVLSFWLNARRPFLRSTQVR
jgi:phosphatidylcholine synthase